MFAIQYRYERHWLQAKDLALRIGLTRNAAAVWGYRNLRWRRWPALTGGRGVTSDRSTAQLLALELRRSA